MLFFALFSPVAGLNLGEASLQITYLFRLAKKPVYEYRNIGGDRINSGFY